MIFRLLALAAFVAALSTPGTARAFEEKPLPAEGPAVAVGCLYELSGPGAASGRAALAGTRLAVERINQAGGLLGRRVRLVVRDAADSALALDQAVAEMSEQDNATAFVGLLDAATAQSAGAAAQAGGRLFLCAGASLDGLPADAGPLFFTAAFDNTAQAEALAALAAEDLGLNRAVLVVDPSRETYAQLGAELAQRLSSRGVKILTRLKLADGGVNAGALAEEIARYHGPELLVLASGGADAAQAVKAFRAAGLAGPIIAGAGLDAPDGAPALGDDAGTVYYAAHADYQNPNELVQLFVQEYAQATGAAPVSGLSALGFDAAALLAHAVNQAESLDSKAAARALSSVSGYEGVTGSFTYGPKRRAPLKPVRLLVRHEGSLETVGQTAPAASLELEDREGEGATANAPDEERSEGEQQQ